MRMVVRFLGRDMRHPEVGMKALQEALEELGKMLPITVDQQPRMEGRQLFALVRLAKGAKLPSERANGAARADATDATGAEAPPAAPAAPAGLGAPAAPAAPVARRPRPLRRLSPPFPLRLATRRPLSRSHPASRRDGGDGGDAGDAGDAGRAGQGRFLTGSRAPSSTDGRLAEPSTSASGPSDPPLGMALGPLRGVYHVPSYAAGGAPGRPRPGRRPPRRRRSRRFPLLLLVLAAAAAGGAFLWRVSEGDPVWWLTHATPPEVAAAPPEGPARGTVSVRVDVSPDGRAALVAGTVDGAPLTLPAAPPRGGAAGVDLAIDTAALPDGRHVLRLERPTARCVAIGWCRR